MIGNLNEDGYLTASDEELMEGLAGHPTKNEDVLALVEQGRNLMRQLDPAGVGARDLRECLLWQIEAQRREAELAAQPAGQWAWAEWQRRGAEGAGGCGGRSWRTICRCCSGRTCARLRGVTHRPAEEVQEAVEYIRRLDPRPGQSYNQSATRLIEPDVAFVKRDDEYVVVMNEENMPSLRLNNGYRKMLREKGTEREVREYVKERYQSAIQLLRNIEQRKNTIVRTCEVIVRRQQEFLETGRGGPAADDDQGGRRGDRRASFDGEPRGGEQVCAYAAGRV